MNVVLETLHLRHPRFDYISPAICEAIFSGSGSPGIVLDPVLKLVGPTGGVLGGTGAGSASRLFWASYPGALCYSIWTAADPGNPDSPYNLASECVHPNSIVLCSPGFYQITAITTSGETEKSSPIEVPGTGYVVIPLPSYPGTICYQLYKSFTIDGYSALYWSCFSGDGINVQTCGPCVKVSVITPEGETPLSDPVCPEDACDITDPAIGKLLCGDLLDWSEELCSCVPCAPPTPCEAGTHWDETTCTCVPDGGGGGCVDWDSMVWTAPLTVGGSPAYVFGGSFYSIDMSYPGEENVQGGVGTVLYTGDGCQCRATINRDRTPGYFHEGGFVVKQDGVVICDGRSSNYPEPAVNYTIDFSVAAGTNSVITVEAWYDYFGIFKFWEISSIMDPGVSLSQSVQFSNI